MGGERKKENRPLRVTLEYIEALGAQIRLSQAFRFILAQSPTCGPDHVSEAHKEGTESLEQSCEVDP